MLGPRADDSEAKTQLYKQIAREGYCKLENIESSIDNKFTLNTTDAFLIGCGLMSDLVTEGLELKRTEDSRKQRTSTFDKIDERQQK